MDDFEIVNETLTLFELFGRLHPAAVHLPIAATLLLLGHELAGYFGVKGFRESAPWYAWITLFSYLPGIATGWARSKDFESEALIDILIHRNFILLAFGVMLAACGWRLTTGKVTLWYLLALLVALVFMGYAADLGGKLVYGGDYFG